MSDQKFLNRLKNIFKRNSIESLLWLVSLPNAMCGLSLFQGEGLVLELCRRIVETILLLAVSHMYIFGIYLYLTQYESDLLTKIQSVVYFAGYLTYCSSLVWIIVTRSSVKKIEEAMKESDSLALQTTQLIGKHRNLMSSIKWFILICYGGIFFEMSIYIPTHTSTTALTDPTLFRIVPCVGMGQIDKYPNKLMCQATIATQIWFMAMILIYFTNEFLLMIGHLTAMYELLIDEMTNVFQQIKYNDANDSGVPSSAEDINRTTVINQESVKKQLTKVAHRHSLLLAVIEKVKILYGACTGVDFGLNLITIFVVIILPTHDILKLFAYLGYGLLHLFLYCMACQRLENASQNFETAVYCCGWEDFDVKNRKSVFIMLLQAQKPVRILAGGILPMNVSSFGTGIESLYKFAAAFKI